MLVKLLGTDNYINPDSVVGAEITSNDTVHRLTIYLSNGKSLHIYSDKSEFLETVIHELNRSAV